MNEQVLQRFVELLDTNVMCKIVFWGVTTCITLHSYRGQNFKFHIGDSPQF